MMSSPDPDTSSSVHGTDRSDVYTLGHWQESALNHTRIEQRRLQPADPRDIPGLGIERILARHIKPQPNGCWYWNGDAKYRGRVQWNGKSWVAYRLVFCFFNHLPHLPRGWHIHHQCEHPGCVNPAHLELLTPLQHLEAHDRIRERCLGRGDKPCAKNAVLRGRCDACRRYMESTNRRMRRHAS